MVSAADDSSVASAGETGPEPDEANSEPGQAESESGQRDWLDYKVVGTLLLFLLLAAKAYGASGFSLTTAAELISASPLSVFFGTIALYTYPIMAIMFVASIWLLVAMARGATAYRRLAPVLLVLAVLTGWLAPLPYLVIAGAGAVLSVGAAALLQTSPLRQAGERLITSYSPPSRTATARAVAGVLLTLFVLLTIRTPWVPAEVVSLAAPVRVNPTVRTNSVSAPVVFVMNDHDGDENGWAELLIDDSRYLVWVRDKDITQRRICHLYSQLPGVDPSFDTLLFRRYHGHDLSCSEITDDPVEKAKRPPFPSWLYTFLRW